MKPFLKWAGGKGSLLPQLTPHFPERISGTYYEPFLGGGAVFFHLRPQRAVLSDINPELINTYIELRDNPYNLIDNLQYHQSKHDQKYYYQIRSQQPKDLALEARAARFIYLNKTCFNGLHRENKSGQFNVPIGASKTPWTVDSAGLMAASSALRGAHIFCRGIQDFPIDDIKTNDFVYFDPPYQAVSKTSNFTSYTKDGFADEDQVVLREIFSALADRKIAIALSNSDHQFVRDLYSDWTIHDILAKRSINSVATKRGNVGEILVTGNYAISN